MDNFAIIWANRLVAGSKTWAEVPAKRKDAVRAKLQSRVNSGVITVAQMAAIVNG